MSRDSSRSRGESGTNETDADEERNRTRSSTRSQSRWGSESSWGETGGPFSASSRSGGPDTSGITTVAEAERYYGRDIEGPGEINALQRLEETYGGQVHEWIEEGVPIDAMGDTDAIQRFRRREDTPVPWDIERFNRESERRNTSPVQRARRAGPSGEVGVPESVREVVASPGRPLDDTIQRAVESRTGDSFGDVRIHTGPRAAQAAAAIDARAFTVGNHIAFGQGEYDPTTPAGQHILVHELAHVRQQTGGALSMLPQADALEVDPDEGLEREAEETARRVMEGGELGIQRLRDTDVHVQRSIRGKLPALKDRLYGNEGAGLDLKGLDDRSGVEERLYALAHNQEQLQAKVETLSTKVEGTLLERVGEAGTGEALKLGMEEAGKESGLPFGGLMGKLTGAALQAIYNNREKVLEILGLKSEALSDQGEAFGGNTKF